MEDEKHSGSSAASESGDDREVSAAEESRSQADSGSEVSENEGSNGSDTDGEGGSDASSGSGSGSGSEAGSPRTAATGQTRQSGGASRASGLEGSRASQAPQNAPETEENLDNVSLSSAESEAGNTPQVQTGQLSEKEAEFLRIAMYEWDLRGFKRPKNNKKVVKWWRKELKKRRRLRRKVANVGGNRLDAKMERIAELKEKKNFIVKFATSVGGEVKKFATDNYRLLKQTLDLPYFREKRKQRAIDEYQERQAEIDEKERAEREKKEREFIEAEKKKQFDKLQRREKVEGEEPRRKFLRRLHRQYQKEEQEQRDKQNLERRRRNVEEAAAEARRRKHEAKELNDKRLHMFRKAQSSYWYKMAKQRHIEAQEAAREMEEEQKAREEFAREVLEKEILGMNEDMHLQQFPDIRVNEKPRFPKGVYSTQVEEEDGTVEDDLPTHAPFVSGADPKDVRFERLSQEVQELESRLRAAEAAYKRRMREQHQLRDEQRNIEERKGKIELDIEEVTEDQRLYQASLDGPPQRQPGDEEIKENHERQLRLRGLRDDLRKLEKRQKFLSVDHDRKERLVNELARSISQLRQQFEEASAQLEADAQESMHLPVVVGKRLADVLTEQGASRSTEEEVRSKLSKADREKVLAEKAQHAKDVQSAVEQDLPLAAVKAARLRQEREEQDAIEGEDEEVFAEDGKQPSTQTEEDPAVQVLKKEEPIAKPVHMSQEEVKALSQLEIAKASLDTIAAAQRSMEASNHTVWEMRNEHADLKMELERGVSHAVAIHEKLARTAVRGQRRDVVMALNRFFISQQNLREIERKEVGLLDWWYYREKESPLRGMGSPTGLQSKQSMRADTASSFMSRPGTRGIKPPKCYGIQLWDKVADIIGVDPARKSTKQRSQTSRQDRQGDSSQEGSDAGEMRAQSAGAGLGARGNAEGGSGLKELKVQVWENPSDTDFPGSLGSPSSLLTSPSQIMGATFAPLTSLLPEPSEPDFENAVRLGPCKEGVLQGAVPLPRHAMWECKFIVTKPNPKVIGGTNAGSPHDYVKLMFGPSLGSLSEHSRIYNQRAEGRRDVYYEVHHKFSGSKLYYKLEWKSDSEDTLNHLIVHGCIIREEVITPIQMTGKNNSRVLTDFVQKTRLEKSTPQQRDVALLSEMIRVEKELETEWDRQRRLRDEASKEAKRKEEASRAMGVLRTVAGTRYVGAPPGARDRVDDMKAKQNMKWVDSDILHPGLLQRYTKEEFFRIFRAHLEKETAPLRAQQEEESSILLEKLKRGEPVTKRARVKLPRRAKTPKAKSTSPQRLASHPRVSFASEGKRPRSTSAHSARSTSRSTTRQHHHAYLNTEEAVQQVPKIQGFKPNYEDDHDVSTHFPPQRRPVRQQLIADERVRVSHDEYLERKHGPKGIDYEKQRELVGQAVEIWDESLQCWRVGQVTDFRVEYRNNKTTVHALHLVKWNRRADEENQEEAHKRKLERIKAKILAKAKRLARAELEKEISEMLFKRRALRAAAKRAVQERKEAIAKQKAKEEAARKAAEEGLEPPQDTETESTVQPTASRQSDASDASAPEASEVGSRGTEAVPPRVATEETGSQSSAPAPRPSEEKEKSEHEEEAKGHEEGPDAALSKEREADLERWKLQKKARSEHRLLASAIASLEGKRVEKQDTQADLLAGQHEAKAEEDDPRVRIAKAKVKAAMEALPKLKEELSRPAPKLTEGISPLHQTGDGSQWMELEHLDWHALSADAVKAQDVMKLEWKKRIKREVAVARKKIEEAMVERRVQELEAAERREEWEEFEEDRKEDLEEVRVQAEKDGLEKVHNCHVEIREKRAKKRSKLANALERRAAQLVSESIAKRMAMKNALQKRQREAKNQARIQKLAGVEGEVAGMEQSKHGPETGWLGEAMKEAHGEIETLDDLPELLTYEEADKIAAKEFVDTYVKRAIEIANEDWLERRNELKRRQVEEYEQRERERALAKHKKEVEDAAAEAAKNARLAKARVDFRKKFMQIPDFLLAIPKSRVCDHKEVEYWGSRYDVGIRCKHCGVQLNDLWKQKGLHIIDELGHEVIESTKHEATFRPRDVTREQEIEAERIKLEKEHREQEVVETQFYDKEKEDVILSVETRHNIPQLSNAGIATPRRKYDAHVAAFRNITAIAGRVNTFEMRLKELAVQRLVLVKEKQLTLQKMRSTYDDANDLVALLKKVGKAHSECEEKIKKLEQAKNWMINGERRLAKLEKLVERYFGIVEEARKQTILKDSEADAVEAKTGEMLRWWAWCQKQMDNAEEAMKEAQRNTELAARRSDNARRVLGMIQWQRKGIILKTPYGNCRVVSADLNTYTVELQPAWGDGESWRIYMPMQFFIMDELAKMEIENLRMAKEEEEMREMVAIEKQRAQEELRLIRIEEESRRWYLKWREHLIEELKAVGQADSVIRKKAQHELQSKTLQLELKARARDYVDEEALTAEQERMFWAGEGKKPKKLSKWKQYKMRKTQLTKNTEEYVTLRADQARSEVKHDWENARQDWAVEATLKQVFHDLLHGYLKEIAKRSLQDGLDAKERAEAETGWIVPQAHAQYLVYRQLFLLSSRIKMVLRWKYKEYLGEKEEPEESEEDWMKRNGLKRNEDGKLVRVKTRKVTKRVIKRIPTKRKKKMLRRKRQDNEEGDGEYIFAEIDDVPEDERHLFEEVDIEVESFEEEEHLVEEEEEHEEEVPSDEEVEGPSKTKSVHDQDKDLFDHDSDEELDDNWRDREGRKEWLKRGLPMEEYTYEKLQQIKEKEEQFLFAERKREEDELKGMRRAEHESRNFYTLERRQTQMERWAMREEDLYMRDIMDLEDEIDRLMRKPGFSEKMLRRHFVKKSVVERNKLSKERNLMEEEAGRTAKVNRLWREQYREAEARYMMSLEDELARDVEDELRYGGDGGSLFSGSEDPSDTDDSDENGEGGSSKYERELELHRTKSHIPKRPSWAELMALAPVVRFETVIRQAQETADKSRRHVQAMIDLREKQIARRAAKRRERRQRRREAEQQLDLLNTLHSKVSMRLSKSNVFTDFNATKSRGTTGSEEDEDVEGVDSLDNLFGSKSEAEPAIRAASETQGNAPEAQETKGVEDDGQESKGEEEPPAQPQTQTQTQPPVAGASKRTLASSKNTNASKSAMAIDLLNTAPKDVVQEELAKLDPSGTFTLDASKLEELQQRLDKYHRQTEFKKKRIEWKERMAKKRENLGVPHPSVVQEREERRRRKEVRRQRRIEKKVEAMRAQGKDEDEIREAIANIKQRGVDDRDVVIPQVDKYAEDLERTALRLAGRAARTELARMVEQTYRAEKMYRLAKYNFSHVRSRIQLESTNARRRRKEAEEMADEFRKVLNRKAKLIKRRAKLREKVASLQSEYKRVKEECEFTDTDIMHKHKSQRFSTYQLHEELQQYYFRLMAQDITTRAEAIGLERRAHRITQLLQENGDEARDKTAHSKRLKRRLVRNERLRLRRSELNKLMFARSRKHTLRNGLKAWLEFFKWRTGVRRVYELGYEIQKQHSDLSGMERRKREAAVREMHDEVYEHPKAPAPLWKAFGYGDVAGGVRANLPVQPPTPAGVAASNQAGTPKSGSEGTKEVEAEQAGATEAAATATSGSGDGALDEEFTKDVQQPWGSPIKDPFSEPYFIQVGQQRVPGSAKPQPALPQGLSPSRTGNRLRMDRFNRMWQTDPDTGAKFSLANNQATASNFHAGIYRMACPSDCPGFKQTCMVHYRMRWSCCDSTDPSPSGGCSLKPHRPGPHPEFGETLERYQRVTDARDAVQQQRRKEVEDIREEVRLDTKSTVLGVQKKLTALRKVVAKYDRLKHQ